MRKILLGVLFVFLFSGCSAARPMRALAGLPAGALQSTAALSVNSTPVSQGKASAPAPGGEAAQGAAEPQETFDAEHAVKVELVEGGIQVIFEQLPQTAEELEALLSVYPLSDPRNVGAFFVASLVRYVDSADDGLAMIDLLRGPRPMNGLDKNFIRDRLRDKPYLPGSYFEGATPENDYTPDAPWTLMVYDDPMEAETGYLYIQVATTGADSPRRITLREKDGLYYLWEYSNVLTGIRLPASLDPWL